MAFQHIWKNNPKDAYKVIKEWEQYTRQLESVDKKLMYTTLYLLSQRLIEAYEKDNANGEKTAKIEKTRKEKNRYEYLAPNW